jgi:outer membrane translocation and assembly module TamA
MKSQHVNRYLLLITFALFSALSRGAQTPPKGVTCRPFRYPTPPFADAIHDELPSTFIEIAGVTFRGEASLPEPISRQMVSALKQHYFDSETDWVADSEAKLREILQAQGYFFAVPVVEPHLVDRNAIKQRVVLDVRIDDGRQFRLGSIHIVGAKLFTPGELRKLVPLQEGEIFSVPKIRDGIEAFTRLYSTRGHIDSTVTPQTESDSERQTISLTIEIDEGAEFRIGRVTILGLSQKAEMSLKIKLKSGDLFNEEILEEFFKENEHLLPANASAMENSKIERDMNARTIDIEFDFRNCH